MAFYPEDLYGSNRKFTYEDSERGPGRDLYFCWMTVDNGESNNFLFVSIIWYISIIYFFFIHRQLRYQNL